LITHKKFIQINNVIPEETIGPGNHMEIPAICSEVIHITAAGKWQNGTAPLQSH